MGVGHPAGNQNKLLSLDQLSNLFECLLALLKEADPASDDSPTTSGAMVASELNNPSSSPTGYQPGGRALEKHQRAEVLRIYQLIEKRL